jgi:hypothetical protein
MTVLIPNEQQFQELNGYQNGMFRLEFPIDGSGRYFANLSVLEYEPFREIWPKLNELERGEFTPFPPSEEEENEP